MVKSIKIINALLCEHALTTGNSKHTLINTYSGDVIVQRLPARLHLALYIEIASPEDGGNFKLEVLVDKKPALEVGATIPESKGKVAAIIVPGFFLSVTEDIEMQIILSGEGYKRTRVMTKKIFKGDIPGVTQTPTA